MFKDIANIPAKSLQTVDWDVFSETYKIADETLVKFLTDANQTDKSLEAFKQYPDVVNKTGKAFNFAALGAKAFNMALNAAIMFAVVKGIELAAKAIDNYVHSNEIAISKASELKSAFESSISTINEHQSTLDSLSSRFTELSKGVDDYGNNVSLTKEQMEEYNGIVKDLIAINPALVKGYDAENQAIIDKNSVLSDTVELLERERQLELEKSTSSSNLKTIGEGAVAKRNELMGADFVGQFGSFDLETVSGQASRFGEEAAKLFNDETVKAFYNYTNSRPFEKMNGKSDWLKTLGFDISDEDMDLDIEGYLQRNIDTFSKHMDEILANANIDPASDQAKTLKLYVQEWQTLNAELTSIDSGYIDEYLQKIPQLVNGYDTLTNSQKTFVSEYIRNGFNAYDLENNAVKVKSSIVDMVEGISSDEKVKSAINSLFALDTKDLNAADYAKQYKEILDNVISQLNISDADSNSLRLKLSVDVDDLATKYDNAIKTTMAKFDGYDPIKFFKDNSINKQEKIDAWLEVAQAASSAAEAEKLYLEQGKMEEKPSFSAVFEDLPIEKIEEYISLLNSGNLTEKSISSFSELNDLMSQTGTNAVDAIKSLKDYADGFTISTDLTSNIQNAYDLLKGVGEQYKKTGKIGLSSLESIAKQYPQLRAAVNEYTQGLISADDMISQLQTAYDNDALAYKTAMAYKLSGDEEFFSTIVNNNKSLFDNLANAYGLDVKNWKTMAQAKAEIDQALIRNLSSAWSKYYNIVFDSVSGLAGLDGGPDLSRVGSRGTTASKEVQEAWSAANDQKNKYNQIISALNEAANIEVEVPDFGGIGANKSGSGKNKKEKEPKTKDFDWIKRRQDLLQKLHDQEEKNADDETSSYQTRIALINSLIAKDNERLEFNKKAAESYTEVWEQAKAKITSDAAKQGKDGDGIIASIINGNTSNQTFEGDLADSIQAGVDAYDDYTAGLENSEQIEQEINEHLKKQLELKVAITQAQTDILKAKMDSLNAEIKLMEATGQVIDKAQLKKQLSLSEEIADSYGEQINALRDQLDEVDKGSAEYYSLRSQITQCEAAIADCAVQQAEWNDQIKRLPIEKISRTLELLGFIKEDLQNFIDQQNALGKATSLPQFQEMANINLKQLEELMKQQKLLSDLLDDYEFGSTKYQDTVSDLQDIDNQISGLIKDQHEWNKAILQLPIDQLSKAGDTLKSVVSTLDEIMSGYDTAISAVTGVLDKQIKAINDLKDATSKEFEDKIKPLQDELNVLQKQNEARKIQLDLEKAQYDLDRANEQKTNKVIRDGKINYEADQDAIRSAQDSKNDADYNKTVHDLQTQISGLEEERDNLLKGYDDQIEKLDEIKDRWSSITEEIKLAADSLKAEELWGADWQDKILSGNDADMLGSIKDLYSTISDQKNQYEEQIASNERIADMMNKYMESWQNGSITYDQAMSGIKDLAAQMKDGYSSLEHLDAIMGLNGATDLGSLLDKMQNSANASVDQFEDYMKIVKENADALDKYNSSWEEMQKNIKDQITALEKLANEASKVVETIRHHSSGGGSDNKGPNTNDKDFVNSGPGVALANALVEKEIPKYHDGGVVRTKDSNSKFIELISAKDLKPDEVSAILRKGEFVMTPEQQNMLKENFINYSPVSYKPPMMDMSSLAVQNRNLPPNVTVTMGDVNLPNVKDPDGFVRFIGSNFESAMRQQFSSRDNYIR